MDEVRLNALKQIENDVTSDGDIKDAVSSLKQLQETLMEEKKQVEDKISYERTNESGSIYSAIKNAEQARQTISQLKSEFELVVKEAKERQAIIENDCKQLKVYSDSANDLDKTLKYFQHLKHASDINKELKNIIEVGNHDKAVELYQSLCTLLRQVLNPSYEYQINFLKKAINYWHEVLKEIFSKEYEEILKTLKWPFISGDTTILSNVQADLKCKFQRYTKYLLLIEIPEEVKSDSVKSSSLAVDFPTISLPHKILLFPLRKRFIYHFCGNKQTNRPDKPEWMFSQVLSWIRDHEYFINEWVQPMYEEESTISRAKIEFMVGLVEIVAEKLQSDLPQLECDDALFSHMVDESLAFHRELVENFSYPSLLTSVLSVLTQAHIFVKWTNMELKFAKKRVDNMINEEMMANVIATEYGHKVTECADLFATLLETMTDRYSALPQPGHRLQFLNLQLDIINEFRVTMQLLAESKLEFPLNSSLPEIANTVGYLNYLLTEWSTTPHFLMLHHYQQKLDPNCVNESVFDEVKKGFKLLIDSIIITLCDAVMLEIKARSRSYRKSWWSSINMYAGNVDLTLSHTATPMFYILTNKLHYLQSKLSDVLFTTCWKSIAKEMSELIFEDVIMANNFSKGGAEQLNFDLCRNLVPLFAQFSLQSENCFQEIIEACGILCSDKKFEDVAKEPDHMLPVNVIKDIYHLRTDRE